MRKAALSILVIFVYKIAPVSNGPMFDCAHFGGSPNSFIDQSIACACPQDKIYCGPEFPYRCISQAYMNQLCTHNPLSANGGCVSSCSGSDCNRYLKFKAGTVDKYILKEIACVCPETKVPCRNSAYVACFKLSDFSGQCVASAAGCSANQFNCGNGRCLSDNLPCATQSSPCTNVCGARYANPSCGTIAKGCKDCDTDQSFEAQYCDSNIFGCSAGTYSDCSQQVLSWCIHIRGYCGVCKRSAGFYNCPLNSHFPGECTSSDFQCQKCITNPSLCTTSTTCNINTQMNCNGKCLPLLEACRIPASCEVNCGAIYRSECATNAALRTACSKCGPNSFCPSKILGQKCPEGTLSCGSSSTDKCVFREVICGPFHNQTTCEVDNGHRYLLNTTLRAICDSFIMGNMTNVNQRALVIAPAVAMCLLVILTAIAAAGLAFFASKPGNGSNIDYSYAVPDSSPDPGQFIYVVGD